MVEVIKVNDRTWCFEDDSVRFFLFCGTQRAALIDSGMNAPDAREIAKRLTDLPLIIINTHADPDHISGNAAFDEIYMSPLEEDNYRYNGGKGKIIPVKEGDVIDLGERTLRIIDIPGHTPGSIAILDETERVLVSGDSVEDGNVFMFGEYRNLNDYIESLKHLLKYDGRYDQIYAMHGSFPVMPGLVDKMLVAAQEIRDGSAKGMPVNVFGHVVQLYKYPCAGFLCDKYS